MSVKPFVSIIVPVYNVEKYLDKCLNSLINQSLQNIEIIIVNDGTKDNSIKIIQKYMDIDNRIVLVNQENQGLSCARNTGLAIAKGEYIGFVDSDDYVEHSMYEKMYNIAKKYDSDLVNCNVIDVYEDCIKTSLTLKNEQIFIHKVGVENYLKKYFSNIGIAVWHKLYKKEIIDKFDLRFVSNNVIYSEDLLFNLCYILHINKVSILDESLYYYVRRENSITTATTSKKNMMKRCIKIVELFDDYSRLQNLSLDTYISYLFNEQFYFGLSNVNQLNFNCIKEEISIARESYLFNRYIYKLLQDRDFYMYSSKTKNLLMITKIFDKTMGVLLKYQFDYLFSFIQILRFKRARLKNSKKVLLS